MKFFANEKDVRGGNPFQNQPPTRQYCPTVPERNIPLMEGLIGCEKIADFSGLSSPVKNFFQEGSFFTTTDRSFVPFMSLCHLSLGMNICPLI